jgi:hypothetical protein
MLDNEPSSVGILDLPSELIERCIFASSKPSLLSLCHVSKLFHSLAIALLYRDVSLSTSHAVIACCRTLAVRPNAASSVRSLSLQYP